MTGRVVLALFAVFLTYIAASFAAHLSQDNLIGGIIIAVALGALATWVDWLAIQRWREIAGRHRLRSD